MFEALRLQGRYANQSYELAKREEVEDFFTNYQIPNPQPDTPSAKRPPEPIQQRAPQANPIPPASISESHKTTQKPNLRLEYNKAERQATRLQVKWDNSKAQLDGGMEQYEHVQRRKEFTPSVEDFRRICECRTATELGLAMTWTSRRNVSRERSGAIIAIKAISSRNGGLAKKTILFWTGNRRMGT